MIQIGAGFALMGTGIALLATAQTKFLVFAFVALLSLGIACVAPNLSALVSKRGGERQAGASLGIQNAANGLGQLVGPLLGGVLFIWQANAPYLLSGAMLIALVLGIAWKVVVKRRAAEATFKNGSVPGPMVFSSSATHEAYRTPTSLACNITSFWRN